VDKRKWIDQSQPQTLQAATMLCYLNAVLAVVYFLAFGVGLSLVLVLMGGAAYGIANEWRWAYWGAVVLAGIYLVSQIAYFRVGTILNLLFALVLVALLLHRQSRAYQKIWFH
jgi:hypothetical protein